MWTSHASSCCACCAPGDQPAPPCVRIVSGTVTCPPDMYRCFAAWLTICSSESVRKSSYMISTTGRMPAIAAPIPVPTIAISEIGVLRTRSGPNSSSSPCVTPIEPPISAMSSPMMKTLSSARIAAPSASRTASRYVTSGIDVLERVLRLRVGRALREPKRLVHDALRIRVERLELVVGQAEPLAEPRDRVVVGRLLAVVLRAVHLRVADVVAVHPVRLDVEENGPVAGARVLERLARRLVHRLDVLAVDLDRAHVVGERALRHVVPHRRVLPAGGRLRPVVVLADEHRLRLPELREVERLVERADVGRAVAEERDGDARLVAQLEREARADDGGQAAADDRVRAVVAALQVVQVHRPAVPVRAALDLAVQLRHDGVGRRPARERVPVRAVRRREDVALLHRAAHADRDRLLADRDVQESRQLSRPEPLLHLLLEPANEEHPAQEVAQRLLVDSGLALDLGQSAGSVRSAS